MRFSVAVLFIIGGVATPMVMPLLLLLHIRGVVVVDVVRGSLVDSSATLVAPTAVAISDYLIDLVCHFLVLSQEVGVIIARLLLLQSALGDSLVGDDHPDPRLEPLPILCFKESNRWV